MLHELEALETDELLRLVSQTTGRLRDRYGNQQITLEDAPEIAKVLNRSLVAAMLIIQRLLMEVAKRDHA